MYPAGVVYPGTVESGTGPPLAAIITGSGCSMPAPSGACCCCITAFTNCSKDNVPPLFLYLTNSAISICSACALPASPPPINPTLPPSALGW